MNLKRGLVVVAGWAAAGAAYGATVSALAVRGNASLQGPGQALPTLFWIEVLYISVASLLGLTVGLATSRRGASRELRTAWSCAAIAGLCSFASLSFVQWAIARFTWHDPEDGWNEFGSICAALIVAAASSMFLQRRLAMSSLTLSRGLFAMLLVTVLASTALVMRAAPARPTGATPVAALAGRTGSAPRVMVIGIDGLDWKRLDPLIEQGRCPNFAKLARAGYRAPLESIEPTWSPIIWNTIATGVGWEQHGIEGFTQVEAPLLERGVQNTYRSGGSVSRLPAYCGLRYLVRTLVREHWLREVAISGDHRRAKAFWNVLSEAGVDVGVVRWWATWPAEQLRGFVVSDNDPLSHQLAKSKLHGGESALELEHMTSPASLVLDLIPLVDPPIGDPATSREAVEKVLGDPMLADLTEAERERHRADPLNLQVFEILRRGDRFSTHSALNLWQDKHVSMCAVYLRAVDNISHRFWKETGVVDHVYEFTDGLLGELLAATDESTTVMLVSDHGWCYEPGPHFAHPDAPDGVLVMSGPGVTRGALQSAESAPSVFDIAPTVLALYGLPQDAHQTGRVLTEAFAPDSSVRAPLEKLASWGVYQPRWGRGAGESDAAGRDEAVRLLRHLGYLD